MSASPLPLATQPEPASVLPFRRERTQDWAAAMRLVEDTAERMRAETEQAQRRETQLGQELDRAQAQIATLAARLHATETRAHKAEAWLRRIHQAIVGDLPPGVGLLESLSGSVLAKLTSDPGQPAPAVGGTGHPAPTEAVSTR